MTKLLDNAIAAVKSLPDDRQNLAGEVLFAIAARSAPSVRLNAEQLAEVRLARAEARQGKVASDDSMNALWNRFGV